MSTHETIPVATIVRLISRSGCASVESVTRELRHRSSPKDAARAFGAALSRGLIETDSVEKASGELLYRLTARGQATLRGPSPRTIDSWRADARQVALLTTPLSVKKVLDVVAGFDQFGGASLQLVAWELVLNESDVAPAWSHAIEDGMIEPSGIDPVFGEEMWRLSEQGRRSRDPTSETTGGPAP